MKTAIATLMMSSALISSPAQAGLAWAQTNFWTAPYESQIQLKLKNKQAGLEAICQDYREMAKVYANSQTVGPEEIETLRRVDEWMGRPVFTATFQIDLEASQKLADEGLNQIQQQIDWKSSELSLPFYRQSAAEIQIDHLPFSEIEVLAGKGSLTEISAKLGLRPLKISVLGSGPQVSVKVEGKDSVCDLLSGEAQLQYQGQARLRITDRGFQDLDGFYLGVEKMTQVVFAQRKTLIGKAALLGYKLGAELEKIDPNPSRVEILIENLMGRLFDSKMERTKLWTLNNGDAHLNVSASSVVPVQIRVGR